MSNDLSSINLVKDKQTPFFDKFINWTLTIGRLIVIVTEVVAVAAFVYRFSLDDKLVNLHSAIKQQQNIISAFKNEENKYRDLQDRIALAAGFSTKAAKSNQTITDIVNLVPKDAMISTLTLNNGQVNLGVDIVSVSSLESLIDSLKSYNQIKSIRINNIQNKPAAGLSTSITVMIK